MEAATLFTSSGQGVNYTPSLLSLNGEVVHEFMKEQIGFTSQFMNPELRSSRPESGTYTEWAGRQVKRPSDISVVRCQGLASGRGLCTVWHQAWKGCTYV
jgi:hypothetical protein